MCWLPALLHLVQVIEQKAEAVHPFIKTGRTHLMDAMPVRMSQVLNGWAQQLKANIGHLQDLQPALQSLAQGGTAVGFHAQALRLCAWGMPGAPRGAVHMRQLTGISRGRAQM